MTEGLVAYRWVISGRVQGVGFRWTTARQADRLGVAGVVANLPDGRVEVLAKGTEHQLDEFDAFLRKGPRSANVENVEKFEIPLEYVNSNSFDIN